jgi:hypothetical protein
MRLWITVSYFVDRKMSENISNIYRESTMDLEVYVFEGLSARKGSHMSHKLAAGLHFV